MVKTKERGGSAGHGGASEVEWKRGWMKQEGEVAETETLLRFRMAFLSAFCSCLRFLRNHALSIRLDCIKHNY